MAPGTTGAAEPAPAPAPAAGTDPGRASASAAAPTASRDGRRARRLVLVFGDQLDAASPALRDLQSADAVLMIEAPGEAEHVWNHKARIALFLAAMRHFRDLLRGRGLTVHYIALADSAEPSFAGRLAEALVRWRPGELRYLEPGEWRLQQAVAETAAAAGVERRPLDDPHFLCSRADFARWAGPQRRKPLRMEYFYREMRRRCRVLLDADGEPEGGRWNFDAANRKPFPKAGPGLIPPSEGFDPDAITRAVFAEVEQRWPDYPGDLASFRWPVTRAQALAALATFIEARLAGFGTHQDAMWTGTPAGWHSLLSPALNLHLLDPREVIAAAEAAFRRGDVPLADAEGFIRQILGWREFMRGLYWLDMPGLAAANHYRHHRDLPAWYWTGRTRMACAAEVVGQTLAHGYAHHIQRLMVTGLFALLAEVEPRQVADWYLAVYVDAVEWVELPNVAGMALNANGGRCTSKPYVASGAYIDRMSNYCGGCVYAPSVAAAEASGRPCCPFTVLYWHFLERHEEELAANPRTVMMTRQLERLDPTRRSALRRQAAAMLNDLDSL